MIWHGHAYSKLDAVILCDADSVFAAEDKATF
jgi:hypothetical protein